MGIKYKFFGKDCLINRELSDRTEARLKMENSGLKHDHLLFVNQIHGANVVVIDSQEKIHGEQNLPKADAMVTNLKNVAISVITADCSPILFFDEEKDIIAATHAGWRGAKLGVIEATIAEMKKLGAQKISAIIGPMIHQDSYEVSQEFFDDFQSENPENRKFFVPGANPGKYLFDLVGYVEKKLKSEGINISNKMIDTYKNEKEYFSFRRSTHRGEKDCGRNISAIVIN